MTNRIPDYLKLFVEEQIEQPALPTLPEFERLWKIFPEVTGLRLNITQHDAKNQLTFPWSEPKVVSYRVAIEPTKRAKIHSLTATKEMEAALAELLDALGDSRGQLRRREAELAASIPVVSVDEDSLHLADRLESVLRGIADMLGCFGAGLYLLDESTTTLKLRSHAGLSDDAFTLPPRRLESSLADIEALSGHAVVIENAKTNPRWETPVKSDAAMCLPVSTATTILGTLWMFRNESIDFTPQEQNLAEIAAGRLAADLDRAVLTQEVRSLRGTHGAETADSSPLSPPRPTAAEAWSEGRLAHFAPFVDGWDLADCRTEAKKVGDFTHWHMIDDNKLHLSVGAAHGYTSKEYSSVALQSLHSAHTSHDPSVKRLFDMTNQSLWTSSIEGDASSLLHGVLDPTCGAFQYAMVGGIFGYVLRPHGWEPLLASRQPLGVDCDFEVEVHRQMLMPGDVLVAMSSPTPDRAYERDNLMNQIAERMLRYTHLPSVELVDMAAEELERIPNRSQPLSVLVAKREDELA